MGTAIMADRLVLDASAAIAILRNEAEAANIREALAEHADASRWVPSLFWSEVTNVLIRRYAFDEAEVAEAVRTIDNLGLETVESDRAALLASTALAVQHGLSVYDASYLALVERLDARLLTLDDRLASAAGDRAMPARRGIRESRPAYRLAPWIQWSELDRYLDAVREVTIASAR